jgi:Cu+-exporting ATPase
MAIQTTNLSIHGMHCAACVKRVERALGGIQGVTHTKVDLIAGKAAVQYDPAQATESAMKDAVRALGFRVSD